MFFQSTVNPYSIHIIHPSQYIIENEKGAWSTIVYHQFKENGKRAWSTKSRVVITHLQGKAVTLILLAITCCGLFF